MDDYSSEDYSDHDDDYCIVPAATSPKHVEIQTPSNDLQNGIIGQQVDVSESVYFDVLPELEAQTAEEGGCMEQSVYLAVESYFDFEAQAETCLPAALESETVLEESDVIESESLETVEADTVIETGESVIEEFMFEAVESESDLEVEYATEESNSDVDHAANVFGPEAETAVEGDVIGESIDEAVESDYDLEAQVETGLPAALDTETVLEEDYVIESESLETVEADTVVETVESMIEEFSYEVEESESDLEAEYAIKEPNSDVEDEGDLGPESNTAVEGDVIGESIYEAVESDYDLDAEAEDMVEEENVVVEEAEDVVEEVDDVVEEEHDVIDEPLESGNNLQAEAEALVEEGAAMEESIYEPLESNSDLQAEEPGAPAASIEMSTFKAQEPYSDFVPEEPEEPEDPEDLTDEQSDSCEECDLSDEEWDSEDPEDPEDLTDEQSDSCEEESDLSEEEWDSYAEEVDMDSSDSDRTEDEEDDVVVSYLKSSTPIRSRAWKSLVPSWAKLPVTETATIEDSSILESFVGRGPMLMLQECGNAVMKVIETLLFELSRIRNDLRRVLGALFRQRETTKHA